MSAFSAKYGLQSASLADLGRIVTQEERKDYMDKADKQLASSKVELAIPDALGVLLLNFDMISGIVPDIIKKSVFRCFFRPGGKNIIVAILS
jgi:hypothetical protein